MLRKLGFELGDDVIKNISNCRPYAVEQMLMLLRRKIDRYLYENKRGKGGGQIPTVPDAQAALSDRPESDQQQHMQQQPKR